MLHARSRGQDLFYAPGGKKEAGETDVQTLVREVQEELGVRLDPATARPCTVIVAAAHGVNHGRVVRMACYTATPWPGRARTAASAEIAELAWLGPADRDRCAEADRILLDVLQEQGLLRPS